MWLNICFGEIYWGWSEHIFSFFFYGTSSFFIQQFTNEEYYSHLGLTLEYVINSLWSEMDL